MKGILSSGRYPDIRDLICDNRMQDVEDSEKDLQKRIDSMRTLLESGHSMKEFDRQVFESIVDYVVVGGYDEQENAHPAWRKRK